MWNEVKRNDRKWERGRVLSIVEYLAVSTQQGERRSLMDARTLLSEGLSSIFSSLTVARTNRRDSD